jgi:hypothetical protein
MRSAALAVAVLVSQIVFVAITAFGTPCPERCPDDGPDGRCPPLCMTCPCAAHAVRPAPPTGLLAAATTVEPAVAAVSRGPRAPEPRAIFHVPKRLLA